MVRYHTDVATTPPVGAGKARDRVKCVDKTADGLYNRRRKSE